jgi:ubiquinone/menaquinone biosynthesis C-methylase UbiE
MPFRNPSFDQVIQQVIPEVEFHQNRYARGLAEVIQPGFRWLDIGAGTRIHHGWIGASEHHLASRADILIGCDLVGDHLARNGSLTGAAVGGAGQLPFRDECFDVVTANMVLEHLEHPRQVFTEVERVLKPGGHFVFVTPNRWNPVVWLASLLLSKPARKALARLVEGREAEHVFFTFYRANSPRAIQGLIAGTKLHAQQLERFRSYPFIRRPVVVTYLEALWIRAGRHRTIAYFSSNLFGDLQKASTASSSTPTTRPPVVLPAGSITYQAPADSPVPA